MSSLLNCQNVTLVFRYGFRLNYIFHVEIRFMKGYLKTYNFYKSFEQIKKLCIYKTNENVSADFCKLWQIVQLMKTASGIPNSKTFSYNVDQSVGYCHFFYNFNINRVNKCCYIPHITRDNISLATKQLDNGFTARVDIIARFLVTDFSGVFVEGLYIIFNLILSCLNFHCLGRFLKYGLNTCHLIVKFQ